MANPLLDLSGNGGNAKISSAFLCVERLIAAFWARVYEE